VDIAQSDIVLCSFYFSDSQQSKKRPVLVFKDNLPYDDFIAIPISSQTHTMHEDEWIISAGELRHGSLPKTSKLMMRKTFVVSKQAVLKKYGALTPEAYQKYHHIFCRYFGCDVFGQRIKN